MRRLAALVLVLAFGCAARDASARDSAAGGSVEIPVQVVQASPEHGETSAALRTGLSGRGVWGSTVGPALGFDVAFGAALPAAPSYRAELRPLGFGVRPDPHSLIALTAGGGIDQLGTEGFVSLLSLRLRAELDAGALRWLLLAGSSLHGGPASEQRSGDVLGDEPRVGVGVRFGRSARFQGVRGGSGLMIAIEWARIASRPGAIATLAWSVDAAE